LSRLQFALTTAFHIIFPPLTIGLAIFLVAVEWMWLRTKDVAYYRQFRFWSGLFAINFAVGRGLGHSPGVPVRHQLGAVLGHGRQLLRPVLGFEGTMAFMLESAFLYIMLFGWKRVGPKMHFFATIMVAFAASLSAFWIMVANSWMQTPSGGHLAGGIFVVDNYWAAIFSPDLPFAFLHMVLACLELSVFVVGAVSGLYIFFGKNVAFFLKSFKLAVVAAIVVTPLQALIGDVNGQEIGRLQPAKVAAIESHWVTNKPGEPAAWKHAGLARSRGRAQPVPDSGPLRPEPAHHPFADGASQGSQGFPQGRPTAYRPAVLHLPPHGRHRLRHGGGHAVDAVGLEAGTPRGTNGRRTQMALSGLGAHGRRGPIWPCSPAGSPGRWGASPGWPTASSACRTAFPRCRRAMWACP